MGQLIGFALPLGDLPNLGQHILGRHTLAEGSANYRSATFSEMFAAFPEALSARRGFMGGRLLWLPFFLAQPLLFDLHFVRAALSCALRDSGYISG
jgi:hypothetical protein